MIIHETETAATTLPVSVIITRVVSKRRRKSYPSYEATLQAREGLQVKPSFQKLVGMGKTPEAAMEDLGNKVLKEAYASEISCTTPSTPSFNCDYTGTT